MVKYRLHNITVFSVAVFVDPPYWVENLETNKNIYTGFDEINNDEFNINNVTRETLHETPTEWIARHTPTEEKEPYTKSEKISSFLGILSVIIMATFLLYLFLSSVSFIAEHFSDFTWKIFSIL